MQIARNTKQLRNNEAPEKKQAQDEFDSESSKSERELREIYGVYRSLKRNSVLV